MPMLGKPFDHLKQNCVWYIKCIWSVNAGNNRFLCNKFLQTTNVMCLLVIFGGDVFVNVNLTVHSFPCNTSEAAGGMAFVFPFSCEGRYGEVFGWSAPTCTLDHTLGFLPAFTCYSNHCCDIRSACLNFTEVWAKSNSSSWKLMSGIRFWGGWESVCVSEKTEMRSAGSLISLLSSEQRLFAEWTMGLRMMRKLRLTCRQRETATTEDIQLRKN